ncbi:MAG: DNA mismatch repair endonuclease MutL [Holosporaceae bacterium]|jgi:DNA mismatch repair protein MutL|nr:DNA mismatch repair endonuclease MutL [Holosporaceae bacterium]
MPIKLLPQNLINQIAAGEVIERPSSVIKELMENSIDAGATEISVRIIDAGKSFMAVEDNGSGMDREALEMCLMSHATSKLDSENLFDIHTFGFRGEALPSIASISRLSVSSSCGGDAWCIQTEGGSSFTISPINRKKGATIEVRDLFFATPARLKFLKSDPREADNCRETFQRMALAFRGISFRFSESNTEKYRYEATDDLQKRVADVFGEASMENLFRINAEKDGMKLYGFVSVPTFNKISTGSQYFFVNNRYVKDKIFSLALKSAYSGLIPPGRYPMAVIFLEMPHSEVDVNAHPAKTEIRFRNSEKVRSFMVSEFKQSLSSFGSVRPTSEFASDFFSKREYASAVYPSFGATALSEKLEIPVVEEKKNWPRENFSANDEWKTVSREPDVSASFLPASPDVSSDPTGKINLGNALFQLENTYIIAENGDHLIIVDQHAAAERITLEKLKRNLTLDSQTLLMPEVCPLTKSQVELLQNNVDFLLKFGIYFEKLAEDMVVVNSLPALLGTCDAKLLMTDVADELSAFGDIYDVERKINAILSIVSCHGSLRAGKKLTAYEMNCLLRQMEETENIAQCCHGRPAYAAITMEKLNKFFERS